MPSSLNARAGRTSRVARGRATVWVVAVALAANEFVGICISGAATGHFSLVQGIGLTAVAAAGVLVFAGFRRAQLLFGGVPVSLGAYGILHLMGAPHDVNLHSVLMATQSVIRLAAGAVLLLSRDVAAFCSAARNAATELRRRRR